MTMARKLAYSVVARETAPVDEQRPEQGVYVVREELFEAGSELPKWAQKVVGDHVYEVDDTTPEAVAPNGSGDDREVSEPGEPADDVEATSDGEVDSAAAEDEEKPAGNASLEAWQDYARSKGASDADLEGKSRNDLRDAYGA